MLALVIELMIKSCGGCPGCDWVMVKGSERRIRFSIYSRIFSAKRRYPFGPNIVR
jgi:hypothetical protein